VADQLAAPTRARAGPALAVRVVNDRRQRGRLLRLLPGGASGCHAECSNPVAVQLNCSTRLCCESTIFVVLLLVFARFFSVG